MSNPLENDDDLFVSTLENLPGGADSKQELNHNDILGGGAVEDINLNDDDDDGILGGGSKSGPAQLTPSNLQSLPAKGNFQEVIRSPLEQDASSSPSMSPTSPPLSPQTTYNGTSNNPASAATMGVNSSQSPHMATTNNNEQHKVTANGQPDDRFIIIDVASPTKVGDGIGAYLVYKITTKTNLGFFKKSNFVVSRRFSDFLGLYEKLVEKHLHSGRIIPPAPEKSVIGMTKVKMGGKEEMSSDEFVERRRASLERFLIRVSRHPVLIADPDFREFLELEGDLPKSSHTSTLSGAGVIKLFSRVGDTVNKTLTKMDENDSWFEDKSMFIENLDIQLRKLHSSVDYMVQQRKELAINTGIFSKSAAMLGNCEEHTGLSRALSKLSEVTEKVEQTQSKQANHDFYCLAELLKDYIGLVAAIKDAFYQRVKVYQTWQHAQSTLTKKRENLNKLQMNARNDKVPQARNEVEEWEAKVERGEEEFKSISKIIKQEVESFEVKRIEEFKNSIIKYLECLLETQQQLIAHWETFLPEAKRIEL